MKKILKNRKVKIAQIISRSLEANVNQSVRNGGLFMDKGFHFFDLANWFVNSIPKNIVTIAKSISRKEFLDKKIKNIKITENLEKGIFNFTLEQCEKKNLIKKWSNEYFVLIYIQKVKALIFNLNNNDLKDDIFNSLPFKLTESQEKVIHELESDMTSGKAMHRLLQGDVGSGKTIVAVIVSTLILNNKYQVAFMAPTEILANQHFKKIKELFLSTDVRTELLTGSIKGKKRDEIINDIESGKIHYVIGTHALFQDNIYFKKLGLCIIDEQHRFGVKQRLDLMSKGKKYGHQPNLLMMSATPIPRTLSMSYFADLEVSPLSELPKGRVPVVTKLVRDSRRKELMNILKYDLENGNQIYWVCPLVEESDKLALSNKVNTYEEFVDFIPKERVGLIHGRMKDQEKDEVMSNFLEKKIKLLGATTVIEVGVDVPNASFIVIEHAERMGLSQLHQLRGRVGRGAKKSVCILIFKENLSELAKERLKIIYENQDGFLIAENDLKIRGPGEMIGTRQSGIPGLRIANLVEDADLVKEVSDYSEVAIKANKLAAQRFVEIWFQDKNYLRI